MSWKCKIGCHDYEQVEFVLSKEQLELNMQAEIAGCPPCRIINESFIKALEKKVCLRCGKKVDEITPARQEIEATWAKAKARRDRAKKLYSTKKKGVQSDNRNYN